ncbi:MAG: hypothetical protein KJ771_03485 [Nanoarchaeota archaeon]|nr:hypothetical protein [Nanoarchaeota archaeon]
MLNLINKLDDDQLWLVFAESKSLLKKRKLVRSSNIVGERGEHVAINIYNNTPHLPKLKAAIESTQNIDAISNKGERYSIKTLTYPHRTTGVFFGLVPRGSSEKDAQKFEYLIIVVLDNLLQPLKIVEVSWDLFCEHKQWHSRMNAWNISLTKKVLSKSRIIYER